MTDWFTVEKLDADTYVISEYKHWEETHCYLVCGKERALVIDTGLGVANLREVVDCLTALPVMAVTTHVHWDHIGGHRHFENIAVHEAEKDWLAGHFPIPLQVVKQNLLRGTCDFPSGFRAEEYQLFQGEPQRLLHDGDCLELGGRTLTVVHTPGHSPGHCCFYEPDRQYLFSGDLIYCGCLDAFYPTTDPAAFARSVRRVREMSVRRILPGHHRLEVPVEIVGRIDEGFRWLEESGKCRQGNGVFDFGEFQIHL